MRWTIAQVAGAVGARAGAGLDPVARVAGVSIDSRTVRAGELFIAIHGPRHDGHDHVAGALECGAFAANASRWPTPSSRSSNWREPYGKRGAGKSLGSPGASARPLPKRSWRHCWA